MIMIANNLKSNISGAKKDAVAFICMALAMKESMANLKKDG